jgi:hypothetical protein
MSSLADRASLRKAKIIEKLDSVSDAEIVAFTGPNADRFLPAWHDMKDQATGKKRFVWRWCWPAFFFGFAWFLYRRMYAHGAVFLFLPILLVLFTPVGDTGTSSVAAVLAVMAKNFYVGHARNKIHKIKERAASAEEAAAKIVRAGGVSLAGGVIGGFIWIGSVLLAFAPLLARMAGSS